MKKEKGEREWASECGGGFSRSPGQGQGRPVKVTWAVTGQEASREERRTLQAWEMSSVETPLAALRSRGVGGEEVQGGAEGLGVGAGLSRRSRESLNWILAPGPLSMLSRLGYGDFSQKTSTTQRPSPYMLTTRL